MAAIQQYIAALHFRSYTAVQKMLSPIEIARGIRKIEGNYSGDLGNNTSNLVKSAMGYLVTQKVKVSTVPLSQIRTLLH